MEIISCSSHTEFSLILLSRALSSFRFLSKSRSEGFFKERLCKSLDFSDSNNFKASMNLKIFVFLEKSRCIIEFSASNDDVVRIFKPLTEMLFLSFCQLKLRVNVIILTQNRIKRADVFKKCVVKDNHLTI